MTVDDANLREMQNIVIKGKVKSLPLDKFEILKATKAHVEYMILDEMRIVITTCKASNMSRLGHLTFERVIIDEAA